MAKLTTHTTGKVENTLKITRAEVIAMLREKFPMIPGGRDVDILFEVDTLRDLDEVIVEWKSTTQDEPAEREVEPVKAGCGRVCAKPPASALDAMKPPNAAPAEPGNFEDHF